jgi:hypothetical protein
MLKSNNTKLNAVLVVAVFAIAMTLSPAISNFQTAFAHYGVDIDQCKDDEDYYEDNEEACDKNLRAHYDDDYNGDFGSKSIDDDNDDNDDHDDNNGNGNSASQGIGQSQSSSQNSQCVSGDDTNDSCNNVSVQNQDNDGNNALGQQGGNGKGKGGNDADQGIGQSQSSKQNCQCVSGGSLGNSCNNVSVQNQDNDGNNAAAQDGGNSKKGKGGNDADQGIGQDQDSEQNSQCVSGEDATVSCNNVSFQNQVNSGNNALAQLG